MNDNKNVRVGIMSFLNIYMGSIPEDVYKILVEAKSKGEFEVDIPEDKYNAIIEADKQRKASGKKGFFG